MNTLYTLLVLGVAALILGGLIMMQRKYVSFTKRVLVALVVGIIFGAALQLLFENNAEIITNANTWIGIVGNGYVRLLNMIVIPLVFVAITTSIVNQDSGSLRKSAASIIIVLLLTTAIAAGIGAGVASAFKLSSKDLLAGQVETSRGEALEQTLESFKARPIPQQITEIIPRNAFYAMTGQESSSTLSVVFFATFIGIAVLGVRKKKPDSAQAFTDLLNTLHDVVMRMVTLTLRLTPYGIFALISRFVSTSNFSEILRLIEFLGASYLAIALMFIVHMIILTLYKLNPFTYLKKASAPLTFAFSSRSSAGTLPLNVETQIDKLGVAPGIANLSASMGVSIGQNGCAGIYPAMLAIMIATGLGLEINAIFIIKLIIITAISSFGIAGVGGGATFAALTVLSSMGLPVALVGLLIAIEPLIDMARTALNVSGAMLAGVISAKRVNELDLDIYNQPIINEH